MSMKTSAKVASYMMFIHYYIQECGIDIPPNFALICRHISKLLADFIDGKDMGGGEDKSHRWRFAIDWGLHFLSAPVPIVDYSKVPDHCRPEQYIDSEDLNEDITITTLWRVFTDHASHFSAKGLAKLAQVEDIDNDMADKFESNWKNELFVPDETFDFQTELNKNNEELNSMLGKRKDFKQRHYDDQRINDNGLIQYSVKDVAPHSRGQIIYNENDVEDMMLCEEEMQKTHNDIVFGMFMANDKFVQIMDAETRKNMV